MKIEVENVKGFQDILPPESLKRRKVREIIEKHFRNYGFLPFETPIIEFDELIRGDNIEEDEAVSDRFRLKDRAGRNLGLRYEFTFQLAKILKLNPNIKLPFRRYQIGEVFRDEPIGPGRFRQFTQCDADIIGDESIDADFECILLANDILKELGVEIEINLNNRKLINSIIESVEIDQKEKVMKEIDKLDKIGEDQVKTNLKKYTTPNQVITLFKLLEKNLNFFRENKFDGADEIDKLIKKCNKENIIVKFNPRMIRGLGYYTGNIFEVKEKGENTIAAGGRYDKSVGKLSEKEIPAVGISFGLDRLTNITDIEINNDPKVLVISIGKDKASFELLKILRTANISSIMSTDKVGKSLEYANSYKIPYVIFVGEQEVAEEKYKIRNMEDGKEEMLGEKRLISKLKR